MKLWLDDERPAPKGWCWAQTVDEAISEVNHWRLSGHSFQACSLDHDLGQGPGQEGHDFLNWLIENGVCPSEPPTVHSMNPAERVAMQRTIDRYWPWNKEN